MKTVKVISPSQCLTATMKNLTQIRVKNMKESQVAMMKEGAATGRKGKIACLNMKLFLTNTFPVTVILGDDTEPHNILEKIVDDTFILSCTEATNEHGANDPNFENKTGEITTDVKGIYFVRDLFPIRWHIRL